MLGDCLELLPSIATASVDAIVTDPPYGLEFMGKEWDRFAPETKYRGEPADTRKAVSTDDRAPSSRHHVSFPMGHPTFRRCTRCGKREFSGSPCRCADPVWVYEQPEGTPTKMAAYQAWCEAWARETWRVAKPGAHLVSFGGTRTYHRLTCAIEDAGWDIRDSIGNLMLYGWIYGQGYPKSHNGPWGGTGLKPAWEPIILARKPLEGTVAATFAAHGTGGLNVDACRIEGPAGSGVWGSSNATVERERTFNASPEDAEYRSERHPAGRWPPNVAIDEAAAAALDAQAGELASGAGTVSRRPAGSLGNAFGAESRPPGTEMIAYGDAGGASRFYYCAMASRAEREWGLESLPAPRPGRPKNDHPTVKPVALLRWLVRLVTPTFRLVDGQSALVLDPFVGSGTTGMACHLEGIRFLGMEQDAAYVEIARRRIAQAGAQPDLFRP